MGENGGEGAAGATACLPSCRSYGLISRVVTGILKHHMLEYLATAFGAGDRVLHCDPQAVSECLAKAVLKCVAEAAEEVGREVGDEVGGELGEALKSMLGGVGRAGGVEEVVNVSTYVEAGPGEGGYGLTDLKADAVRAAKLVTQALSKALCVDGVASLRVSVEEEYIIGGEGSSKQGAVRRGRVGLECSIDLRRAASSLLNPDVATAYAITHGGLQASMEEGAVAAEVSEACASLGLEGRACVAYEIVRGAGGAIYLIDSTTPAIYVPTQAGLELVAGREDVVKCVEEGSAPQPGGACEAVEAVRRGLGEARFEEVFRTRRRG